MITYLKTSLFHLLALLFMSSLLYSPARAQEKAKQADLAVDIVGINTHLYYTGTVYVDRYGDIIKPRLQELGVRHLRDGNPVGNATFDARVKELASLGMKFILICDTRFGLASSLTQSKDHIKSLNADATRPVLMVEGPNEFDCPNQSGFMAELTNTTKNLWNIFKGDGATSNIPVAGPSFCNTASSPGNFANYFPDATNYMQYGNLHPYPAGLHVEGSGGGGWGISFDEAVRRYKLVSGNDPLILTETGYKMSGDVEGHISVTQRAAAKYIPRSMLYYLNKGITRTYLYQLINNDSEDFGVLNNDGTPRQQFTALKNYISLLKDPGASFETGSLTYSLSGDLTNIHRTLLQKRDGRFYLILWQGVNSCNPGQVNVEPAARSLTLNLGTAISSAKVYLPTFNGTSAQASYTNPTSIALSVPDHIVVVELTPGSSTGTATAADIANGTYMLLPECATGTRLDVEGGNTTDGTNIRIWTDNGNNAQRWAVARQGDGSYRLTSALNSAKVLDVAGAGSSDGTNVHLWTWNGGNAQKWDIYDVGNGYYKLIPRCAPGKCLDVAGGGSSAGTNVQIWTDNGATAQRWRLIRTDGPANGTYTLTPECAQTTRLDVAGASTTNGTNIQIWTDNGHNAQKWVVQLQADGYYRLTSALNNTKVLDVAGAGSSDGTNVHLWDWHGGSAQRWNIINAGNGYYKLTPLCAPGKCLDVNGGSSTAGTNVQIWTDNGATPQRWKFTSTAAARQGFEEKRADTPLLLSPNPATDKVTLKLGTAGAATVKVTDLQGRMLLSKKLSGSAEPVLDVAHLADGLYLVQLTIGGKTLTQKLLIQR